MSEKKLKKILLLGEKDDDLNVDLLLHGYKDTTVDSTCKDVSYDLVIYVDKAFRMNIPFPNAIADAELWFERTDKITSDVFLNALSHFEHCEIRKGK